MLWKQILAVCIVVGAAFAEAAQESYVLVPKTLDEIANPNFRAALSDRSPEYDGLDRRDQVFYFIQAYKSLNNGQDPALTSLDAWQVGLPAGLPPSAPPYAYPGYSAERYAYYPGYGLHRLPPVRSVSPGAVGPSLPPVVAPPYRELPPNVLHRVEPRRVEPVHVEPIRVQPIRVEPERVEPDRVEPRHVEPIHLGY